MKLLVNEHSLVEPAHARQNSSKLVLLLLTRSFVSLIGLISSIGLIKIPNYTIFAPPHHAITHPNNHRGGVEHIYL